MDEKIPEGALNMPIEMIERALGRLTMHNIALQAEVERLRNEILSHSANGATKETAKEEDKSWMMPR
jgi:hypothetical protein